MASWSTSAYTRDDNRPYFAVSAKFAPFTVQVAGDVGYNNEISTNTNGQIYANLFSKTRLNGAFRVSGEKIADLVTFDVTYKFHGGDANTQDTTATPQPDGQGVSSHSFGLYANLFVVDGLGIGLGYSGLFRSYEDNKTTAGTLTRTGPFYSGIDLRFAYTGIDKLTVTFNNNVSFAGVTGDDDANTTIYGVNGSTNVGNKQTDGWFALYNALGANYKLSDQLTASLQLANRLGTRTQENNGKKTENSNDRFGATAFASYSFNSHVVLAGGLELLLNSTTVKNEATPTSDTEYGTMTFAIPIYLKVVY